MRFSLYLNPQTNGPQDDHRIITEITDMARAADAAGFAGVCLTQHHFSNYNTYSDPLMYGAYLAGQMKQAWVIMTVLVAPLHNPLNLVERVNLLDQLLEGRLLVAIGSGGSSLEFSGLGRDAEDKAKLTAEVMETANRAWAHNPSDGPLEYNTTHASGVMSGRIMPSPYSSPKPKLARAAINQAAWEEAGRRGEPLVFGRVPPEGARNVIEIYKSALAAAGHSEERIQDCLDWSLLQKTVMLADTDEAAMADINEPLGVLERMSAAAFTGPQRAKSTGLSGDKEEYRRGFIEGGAIIGSPATFIEKLKEYEAAGVRHIGLHFSYGLMDPAISRRSFDLFVNEVMPHFTQPARALEQA